MMLLPWCVRSGCWPVLVCPIDYHCWPVLVWPIDSIAIGGLLIGSGSCCGE